VGDITNKLINYSNITGASLLTNQRPSLQECI